MSPSVSTLWTDDKVDETVTSAYVHSQLRGNEQAILNRPIYFGGDLTDNTYLDWILGRARRLFLILVATGIPDQIFGVVDDSFDDDDLPIAEEAVPDLRLSFEHDRALDRRFYKTQFKFLTRVLEDGEHIRYADEETVPITPLGIKVISFHKDGVDTVRLPSDTSKTYLRRRIYLDEEITEESILIEIAEMKKFSHEHNISVFASYMQSNVVNILSLPAAEYTLKSFLTDTPKSFDALSKSTRRQTLINWPHCLANALSWLHANGGHHGAIRPSNIHIDQNYQISLGPLDGEGVLCTMTKADDVESYQYAPPERWKRAVTVQSTGPSKVALPSGGRTARKNQNDPVDPADPSMRKRSGSTNGMVSMDGLGAYAFLPASKSDFARLRLGAAANPNAMVVPPARRSRNAMPKSFSANSRSSTRAMNEREVPTRASSVVSQASSEGRRRANKTHGIFITAPESRTAVVQTWRSVQHNSFAADVFSLGAVIMDILTVLCKRTYSSFTRHRSAKNRNAGRGGGLADASFHANMGQVMVWARTLSEDAEKKAKNDASHVLRAVGGVIQITLQCLERNPDSRVSSSMLEERLDEHIRMFANIDHLHCISHLPQTARVVSTQQRVLDDAAPLLSPIQLRSDRSLSRAWQAIIEEEPPATPSTRYSPSTRPTTSRTTVAPQSPTSVSHVSLASFSVDFDGRSETVVSGYDREPLLRSHNHRTRVRDSPLDAQGWKAPEMSLPKKVDRWDYNHGNERALDPTLTIFPSPSEQGAFNYISYSTSPSEDGEEGTTYHYPLPPAKPPPMRDLPQPPTPTSPRAPAAQREPISRRGSMKPTPAEASREEIAMLQQLLRTSRGGHPVRASSLNPGDTEVEEDYQYGEKAGNGRRPITPAALESKGH